MLYVAGGMLQKAPTNGDNLCDKHRKSVYGLLVSLLKDYDYVYRDVRVKHNETHAIFL